MAMTSLDLAVFAGYCILLLGFAWWISREKAGHQRNTSDYFLASNALPWWAVGTSLIASNISAEQIIGMTGSGYAIGLAIASYEWMAAITLIIIGKYFLPTFLEKKIYTMPQFLEQRFDHRVQLVMAFFWLAVYTFVNLTAVLYLGALAIKTITGVEMFYGMLFLAVFSAAYSLYGGLRAVAFTDIIQVTLLVFGGLMVSYLALNTIADGQGVFTGFGILLERVPQSFDMILSPEHKDYVSLPGISVLIGGLWVMNLSYWGFNQYITQRTLAAKSLREAQKGIALAAFLKLLMPILVVLPGIAALVLVPNLEKPDQAYPEMMKLVPAGLLGLTFAALVAAIASSLSSMANSVSTIFTMDIYRQLAGTQRGEKHLVLVGRTAALTAMVVAMVIAEPLLGKLDQAFQYIQEFTGFFTPGVVAIFLLGFFYKRANATSALVAGIGSVVLSALARIFWPELPFMDRVGLIFVACLLLGMLVAGKEKNPKAIETGSVDYSTSSGFNLSALCISLILVALYYTWW
ncbi:sodium/sugar symporter [Microbulbifer rhizosphaerae]|uniref:SSS family solute:Na+ symporter n=1 Tax=Microbulbifer rhizosphaerae TaxID=1562603 RepID=A0A7W4ZAG9_9GAMM|nr:sodium/sugar symporter [Microbulbifer rhizosphaerae]MBB3062742.1 SSS family solute:Na+ symporter [Microbulbifer rhizosphaerae]